NPYPETGAWDAKDDSKTGFFMEVQNGIMAGAYFGADAAGDNVWLIFSGQLQPAIGGDGLQSGWVLESPLRQTTAAGCILDCDTAGDVDPATAVAGQITLEFNGRSQATFSVDDSEPTEIYPTYWGNAAFAFDPEQPQRFLPNLTGSWVAVKVDELLSSSEPSVATYIVAIGEREVVQIDAGPEPGTPFLEVRYPLSSAALAPPPVQHTIVCTFYRAADVAEIESPECRQTISTPQLLQDPVAFFNTITDSRFTMFGSTVDDVPGFTTRVDFFRLNYD
ncbi:MAG: hypothetical protein PF630_01555, partial [Gammaproteobacteria bacterium]|nr:hypothetical protein [Gammaproteobacteria bacterium]